MREVGEILRGARRKLFPNRKPPGRFTSGEQIALPPVPFHHRFTLFEDLPVDQKEKYWATLHSFKLNGTQGQHLVEKPSHIEGLTDAQMSEIAQQAHSYDNWKQGSQENGLLDALYINRVQIPPEIGMHFDAHGIARGTFADQIRDVNSLLTKSIDPERIFYTAKLRLYEDLERSNAAAVGSQGPFATGGFIVIGQPDHYLTATGIAAVLVNEHFYGSIPTLQQVFSSVSFIRAEDLDKKGQAGPLQVLIDSNR